MAKMDLISIKNKVADMRELAHAEIEQKYLNWLGVQDDMAALVGKCLSDDMEVRIAGFQTFAYPAVIIEADVRLEERVDALLRDWAYETGFGVRRGATQYEVRIDAFIYVFRRAVEGGEYQHFMVCVQRNRGRLQ